MKFKSCHDTSCRHWWHCRLLLWRPAVPLVKTKLALWQLSIFRVFFRLYCDNRGCHTDVILDDLGKHYKCWWPGALAPGHQYPQCWSHSNARDVTLNNLGKWTCTNPQQTTAKREGCKYEIIYIYIYIMRNIVISASYWNYTNESTHRRLTR